MIRVLLPRSVWTTTTATPPNQADADQSLLAVVHAIVNHGEHRSAKNLPGFLKADAVALVVGVVLVLVPFKLIIHHAAISSLRLPPVLYIHIVYQPSEVYKMNRGELKNGPSVSSLETGRCQV